MKPFRPLSVIEQLAAHLREEIRSGGLAGEMPGAARLVRRGWCGAVGAARLVRRLGVGTKTVVAALESLKREGLLEGHGERRRGRIVAVEGAQGPAMRLAVLAYDPADIGTPCLIELIHRLRESSQ